MAGQVKPGKQYWPEPKPDRGNRSRLTRQKRERMKDDAEYLAVNDIYLENNPKCPVCGAKATRVHHMARGPNRQHTLTNMNLCLGGCDEHGEEFDDAAIWPLARQVALKLSDTLKALNRVRGRDENAITWRDVFEFADVGEA